MKNKGIFLHYPPTKKNRCHDLSKGHFPKRQFSKGNFPGGNFPNVQFPKYVLAAALGPVAHPNRSARPPVADCGASEGLT